LPSLNQVPVAARQIEPVPGSRLQLIKGVRSSRIREKSGCAPHAGEHQHSLFAWDVVTLGVTIPVPSAKSVCSSASERGTGALTS
jgi:hypothetical protein